MCMLFVWNAYRNEIVSRRWLIFRYTVLPPIDIARLIRLVSREGAQLIQIELRSTDERERERERVRERDPSR